MRSAGGRVEKVLDETTVVRCAAGVGIVREEVWQDELGVVVKYNLTFINHFLFTRDNGRVLGYDNAHGEHHRHFKGKVQPFGYQDYDLLFNLFMGEVEVLRKGNL